MVRYLDALGSALRRVKELGEFAWSRGSVLYFEGVVQHLLNECPKFHSILTAGLPIGTD
jgi:hypothetical protein